MIDVSGIDRLKELHRDLSEKSIQGCAPPSLTLLPSHPSSPTPLQLCMSSALRDALRKLWDANFSAEMGEQWLLSSPALSSLPLLPSHLSPPISTPLQLCLSSASSDVLRKLWDVNFIAKMSEQWLFLCLASASRDILRKLWDANFLAEMPSSGSSDVLRKLWDANFLAEMGEQWLFVTPADAVKLCRSVAVAAPAVKEQDELLASVQVYDI
ncbi:unnamed protein product [Closterium sp. NIES-65]|nr:unnamed protein product [Closterium sp. NIES-65]